MRQKFTPATWNPLFLKALFSEGTRGWDIITALRGPDIGSYSERASWKRFTMLIRWWVLNPNQGPPPGFRENPNTGHPVAGYLAEVPGSITEDMLLEAYKKSWSLPPEAAHFISHWRTAARAIVEIEGWSFMHEED